MKRASNAKGQTAVTVELECLGCHARQSVELSGEKFKTLSSTWQVRLDCQGCGQATPWSFSEASVEAEEQTDFWDWLATTGEYFEPGAPPLQDERRKEPRVGVHVPLRLAANGREEEVVSEDISKSGLCFSGSLGYTVGETLRVTLEPPGSLGPQTKAAVIVRAVKLPDGRLLYGARLDG